MAVSLSAQEIFKCLKKKGECKIPGYCIVNRNSYRMDFSEIFREYQNCHTYEDNRD